MSSLGLLSWISSSFESSLRLKVSVDLLSNCGFGVRSNFSTNENFSDYQLNVVVLIFSILIDATICFSVIIEVFIRYYLICEYKLVILSVIIILLSVIIFLLLYLLTEQICEKLTKIIQVLRQTVNFLNFLNQQLTATRHPSQLS